MATHPRLYMLLNTDPSQIFFHYIICENIVFTPISVQIKAGYFKKYDFFSLSLIKCSSLFLSRRTLPLLEHHSIARSSSPCCRAECRHHGERERRRDCRSLYCRAEGDFRQQCSSTTEGDGGDQVSAFCAPPLLPSF